MNSKFLHRFAVPCVSRTLPNDLSAFAKKDMFYLRPNCILRKEPSGYLVVPPEHYPDAILIDEELRLLLESGPFSMENLPIFIAQMLIDGRIVQETPIKSKFMQVITVSEDHLPFHALIESTVKCQCDCVTCYHAQDLDYPVPTLEEIISRIDHLKSLGICQIELTGGEPLLRSDIGEILGYIDSQQLNYCLITNGEFICDQSDETIRKIASGVGLAISIDGIGETHDRIRNRPGLFKKVVAGIERAASYEANTVLITTINTTNLADLPEMISLAERFGCLIHLRPTLPVGNAKVNNIKIEDLRSEVKRFFDHPNVLNGLIATYKEASPAKFYGCRTYNRISVAADGRIFPCVVDRGQYLGRIESYDQEKLRNELDKHNQAVLIANQKCTECQLRLEGDFICNGFCRFSKTYKKQSL